MNLRQYTNFGETDGGVYRDGEFYPFFESVDGDDRGKVDSTLIVTNFNRSDTLGRALDSALKCDQNKGAFEVLVIDDGSTDGSVEILRDYARRKLIRFIALGFNSGSEALPKNIAAYFARGRYLSYLDSDDRIGETDAFDTSLCKIDACPEAVMIVSNLVFEIHCARRHIAENMPWLLDVDLHIPDVSISDPSALEYRRRVAREHSVYELLNHGYYDAFKLMRRDAFLKTGGVVEDLGSCGDFGTYLKLNRLGHTLPVSRDFYVYRIHGGNDSFYSDEKQIWIESQHRKFALGEIRLRGLSYNELVAGCQPEFWERYRFTREEIEGGES